MDAMEDLQDDLQEMMAEEEEDVDMGGLFGCDSDEGDMMCEADVGKQEMMCTAPM